MRLLVTGGRDFADRDFLFATLDRLHAEYGFTLLIHGDARGADQLAGEWAQERGVAILARPADWLRYGGGDAPRRNRQMLDEKPDLVVAFPGGSGTRNMVDIASKAGVKVVVVEAAESIEDASRDSHRRVPLRRRYFEGAPTTITQDEFVQALLRVIGTAGLLAIPFVMVPYSWMDAIHQRMGMGKLPDAPIVGYLARSTSAFYAILGGLLWTISFHLRRYRLVLGYIGVAIVLFGVAILAVDFGQGMPIWWSLAEGPMNVGFGAVFVWFSWRMVRRRRGPSRRPERFEALETSPNRQNGSEVAPTRPERF